METILTNHPNPHTLMIPAADATSTMDLTYLLTPGGALGGVTHTHNVTITVAMFAMLRAGQQVMATSTITGHTHVVQVICA